MDGERDYWDGHNFEVGENGKKTIKDTLSKGNIRKKLINKRGRKCEGCGLKEHAGEPVPLEMHRVDRDLDYEDCGEENLRLLYPNCHKLTDNWGCKNLSVS